MFYSQYFTFHWKLLVTVFDGPEVGEEWHRCSAVVVVSDDEGDSDESR